MTDHLETISHGRDGWATSVITERVNPELVDQFEEWTERANANLAAADGFLGIDTIRVEEETPFYVTLIHFKTQGQLDLWQSSERHRYLLDELEPMIDHKTVRKAEGLEILYSLPQRNRRQNPSYWRQVTLVTPVVFSLIVTVNWLLTPIDALPGLVFLAISVTIVSMLLTWPVMPTITKMFRRFLYPED